MALNLSCTWCSYCCNAQLNLIKHSFDAHSIESSFVLKCGIRGCLHQFYTGTSFASFKTHADRKHPNWRDDIKDPSSSTGTVRYTIPVDNNLEPGEDLSCSEPELTTPTCTSSSTVEKTPPTAERTAALFILTLQEKYKLSQKAINYAVGSINTIVERVCFSGVEDALHFEYNDPFYFLKTENQQSKFYREEFGLIEPVTVELGSSYQYKRSGAKRSLVEKRETFQYIPFIDNLTWLLQNQDIYNEVFKKHNPNHSSFLYDFCDGLFFKQHPIFSEDPQALQIIVYYDDVESANPLGSYRGKHKLGMFYYFIGNISPKLRSALKCTQLIACVSVPNLEKYGFEMILKPFIHEVNKLAEGVNILIHGKQTFIRGGVLYVLADTLAAHDIGGFKSGVGFALRKCRMCMATSDQIYTKFKADQFIPRTSESYDYHCALLDSPLCKEYSTTYGIRYCSPLNELRNFHVVDQLPQDIMHVMLEGVIPHEMFLMLEGFMNVQKYFTIQFLNDRISCFSYSTHEAKDKPTPIKQNRALSQTSTQMWALSINLPLIIGDRVPPKDEKWECFLLLLDILQLCTTRIASSAQAGFLEALISDHHHLFIRCYPGESVPPKMHYMVHFPRQIVR